MIEAAMCSSESVRQFVRDRLSAAAEEIFTVFLQTIMKLEEEVDRQRKLLDVQLNRTGLLQQHVCLEEEVLPEQQLCIQERIFNERQEEPEPPQMKDEQVEQIIIKQETDAFMETPTGDEGDHSENHLQIMPSSWDPQSNREQQLLSDSFPSAESQDQEGGEHGTTGDVKPHACGTCGKRFSTNTILNVHIKKHDFEKQHLCIYCCRGFSALYSLRCHLRIHTGEKPFTCTICGKDFRVRDHLKSHMRTHTGEKPYVCKICGKSFSHMSGLSYHKIVHTGEKPFTCTTCHKSFTYKAYLKRHMKLHAGENP